MSFNFLGVRIKISFLLISLLALFSIYDKTYLSLIAVTAAIIHELSHVITAEMLKCGVKELSFMPFGIKMLLKIPFSIIETQKKLLILSAGSFINFVLFVFFFALNYKKTALIHLITGVFNLLPAKALDGGRILTELLRLKFDEYKSQKISDVVSLIASCGLLFLGSIVLCCTGYNFSLIITSIYLATTVIVRQKKLN